MPSLPSLSITIRRTQWFSSTIVGYARVLIDNRILLNELPVFGHEENMAVFITPAQVAALVMAITIKLFYNSWQSLY